MSAKVCFAISSGSYSDYRVLAVAMDKETAEKWAEALRHEHNGWNTDAEVEEMLLVEGAPRRVHRVDLSEEWWNDGSTSNLRVNEVDEFPISMLYGPPPSRPSVRFVRAPVHRDRGGRIEIRGKTRAAVMKVYSEQKAMWKVLPQAFKEVNP